MAHYFCAFAIRQKRILAFVEQFAVGQKLAATIGDHLALAHVHLRQARRGENLVDHRRVQRLPSGPGQAVLEAGLRTPGRRQTQRAALAEATAAAATPAVQPQTIENRGLGLATRRHSGTTQVRNYKLCVCSKVIVGDKNCAILRFLPQGWLTSYDWNEADLHAALELLTIKATTTAASEQEAKPPHSSNWQFERGLLDAAIYGGRLQHDTDVALLKSILRHIWSANVFDGVDNLGGVLNVTGMNMDQLLGSVDQLRDQDSVEDYLGLPANANRSWEKFAAESDLAFLRSESINCYELLSAGKTI